MTERDAQQKIARVKNNAFMAVGEIEEAAVTELLTLLETSASIPISVRTMAMWIDNHEDMTLGFDVVYRNIGPFGQMVGSLLLMFKVPAALWRQFLLTRRSRITAWRRASSRCCCS